MYSFISNNYLPDVAVAYSKCYPQLLGNGADFRAPKVGLLFWPFSFGPPFAKSQKIRDLGVIAKFTIAQLCEHFLEPPFVLKCSPILRDRKCYISCGVLRPHK